MARSLAVSCDMCVVCVDEEEEGYVCECCDPAKKKKGSESSGENSELEQDEAIGPEVRYMYCIFYTCLVRRTCRSGRATLFKNDKMIVV